MCNFIMHIVRHMQRQFMNYIVIVLPNTQLTSYKKRICFGSKVHVMNEVLTFKIQ